MQSIHVGSIVSAFAVFSLLASAQPEFLILDDSGSKVVRFQWGTGQAISHFVGTGISNLAYPHNGTYGPDGNFYTVGSGSDNVLRYNGQTGQPLGEVIPPGGGGLDGPTDLIFGTDGLLYVTSYVNNRVKRVSLDTFQITDFITPGNNLNGPRGIAFDAPGNWYVVSELSNRVLKYNPQGAFVSEVISPGTLGMSWPHDAIVDSSQRLFVSSGGSHSILVRDLNTNNMKLLFAPGTGGINDPYYLSLGPDPEAIYVVGRGGNGQFLRYNRNSGIFLGSFLNSFAGGLSGDPVGVVFMPPVDSCYADCDANGTLNIDDFICFQTAFAIGC